MSSLKDNNLGASSNSSGSSCNVNDNHSSRIESGGSDSDEDYSHNSPNPDTNLQDSLAATSNTVRHCNCYAQLIDQILIP